MSWAEKLISEVTFIIDLRVTVQIELLELE